MDKRNWWVYLVVFVHKIKLAPPTSYLCFNDLLASVQLILPIFFDFQSGNTQMVKYCSDFN